MISIVCFLWQDEARRQAYRYTQDHVIILRNMVRRNLGLPHRFICVTDETIDGVETVPLDWSSHVPGTTFVRLMLHRADIGKILGDRIFCIDLDTVITGKIDPICSRNEPYIIWKNPDYEKPRRAFFQSSFQMLDAGERSCLRRDFDPASTPEMVNRRFGAHEQAWISERLNLSWPEPGCDWAEATFTHEDGIYSAARPSVEGVHDSLPDGARMVTLPGKLEPSMPLAQERHPWIRRHYH